MLTTTLDEIRKHGPCEDGWKTLTEALGPEWGADEPIPLRCGKCQKRRERFAKDSRP